MKKKIIGLSGVFIALVLVIVLTIPLMVSMIENDVEMYGAQTVCHWRKCVQKFENDVEMYGAQTESL